MLPGLPFKPAPHVNYAGTVLPMRDGPPKHKDFPAEMGGSGELLPEWPARVRRTAWDDRQATPRRHGSWTIRASCLVAERCWDQARWAVEAYAWRFDGLDRTRRERGAA